MGKAWEEQLRELQNLQQEYSQVVHQASLAATVYNHTDTQFAERRPPVAPRSRSPPLPRFTRAEVDAPERPDDPSFQPRRVEFGLIPNVADANADDMGGYDDVASPGRPVSLAGIVPRL